MGLLGWLQFLPNQNHDKPKLLIINWFIAKKINNNGTPMFMAKILANFLETSYIAKERKGAF
jgi:hypothetical protein